MVIGGGAWSSLSSSSQALLVILLVLLISMLFVGTFAFVAFLRHRQRQKLRALSTAQVDQMNGFQFEHYVAGLLQSQGYSNTQVTQASGDYGVDIIALKGGQKWAVQAKRFQGSVSQDAVRQAVAGCAYYGCRRSMVVTTNYFTKHAKGLAHSNGTTLIDRDKLAEWILAFQDKH